MAYYVALTALLLCLTPDPSSSQPFDTTQYNTQQKLGSVPNLIVKNGYPCQVHHIETDDGYILTVHRIPPKWREQLTGDRLENAGYWRSVPSSDSPQHKFPVLFQHGILSNSATWIMNTPQNAPAYVFHDAGYDVWLGNARGNTYSRKHKKWNTSSKQFWQFSWDEMGAHDIPAVIEYILRITQREKLIYVGHSMGTTMFFSAMSQHPVLNNKVQAMFALGPIAKVSHMKSGIKYLSHVAQHIADIMEFFGDYELLPRNKFFDRIMKMLCTKFYIQEKVCENELFFLTGFDNKEFNATWLPVVLDELMSGTSIYTLLHYTQEYLADRFQFYDYGWLENEKRYGAKTPPLYDLSRVQTPVNLIWAENDYLADPQDVQYLVQHIPTIDGSYRVAMRDFNHMDFLWAIDAYELVYKNILHLIAKKYQD